MKFSALHPTFLALAFAQASLTAQEQFDEQIKLSGGGDNPLLQSFINQDKAWYQDARQAYHGDDLIGADGALAKLDWSIAYTAFQWTDYTTNNPGQPFTPDDEIYPYADGKLLLEISCSDDVAWMNVEPALTALGATSLSRDGLVINAWVPIDQAGAASQLAGINFIRPAYRETRAGITTSQGDAAITANLARAITPGITGNGITVGTLSDTFATAPAPITTAPQDVASNDLPTGIEVLSEFGQPGTDEGRAMMQIIHDVAPGVSQKFFTAFNGQADFANGIRSLADAGCDIIVDDVFFFAEPFFQNGLIAQAVNDVTADGKVYFSAAGNSARQSYESESRFIEGSSGLSGGPLHDFDPGAGNDPFLNITIPVGSAITFVLQWDEPFFSISGAPGCGSDIDIFITNEGDGQLFALNGGFARNIGGDAVDIFTFTNDGSFDLDGTPGPDTRFNLAIEGIAGNIPGRMKILFMNRGNFSINEFDTQSSTLVGHANAQNAIAVAAAPFFGTPAFGVNPPQLEAFSSPGGTPLLFAEDGTRLAQPLITDQPRFTSADGANTTFFGQQIGDGDNFPNFFGTSAAAPHAAAVAALLLEKTGGPGTLTPAQIDSILSDTAIDMETAGFDEESGAGLIDAQAAINFIITSGLAIDAVMDEADDSWLTPSVWDDDSAPSPEKDYFLSPVGNGIMRTTNSGQTDATSAVFPGNSLTVPGGTTLLVIQNNERTASIRGGDGDLILDGGKILFSPASAGSQAFLTVNEFHVTESAGSTIEITPNVNRGRLPATLTGPGDLLITFSEESAGSRSVVFAAADDYTGKITVEKGLTLDFNDGAFLPGGIELTGDSILNVDQSLIFEAGTLKDPVNGLVPPGIYSNNTLGDNYNISGSGTITVRNALTVTTNVDEDDGSIDPALGQGVSLREAINHPSFSNIITFAPELNGTTIELDADLGQLAVDESLTIDASNLTNSIIIDGGSDGDLFADENETRCFAISDRNTETLISVTLKGLTIQKGVSTSGGGNIRNRENLTIDRCKILNGRAIGDTADGGGIFSDSGNRDINPNLIITSSDIIGNQTSGDSADGGGIFKSRGNLTMTACTVSDNQTQGSNADGGGIASTDNELTMTTCTVSDNQTQGASATGGGVFSSSGNLTMTACTLAGNQTQGTNADGGGIFSDTNFTIQTTHLIRCTITENTALNADGGAFFNRDGAAIIEHCTIVGNSAGVDKIAGIASDRILSPLTEIHNSVVRDNTRGPDLAAQNNAADSSFTFSGENLIGTVGAGIGGITLNTAPLFLAPLGNYGGPTETMLPLPGSPAINGATDFTATEDQRGFSILDGLPDIGATEFRGASEETVNILNVFDTDIDNDGLSVGVELGIGTDPFVSDFDNPRRPRLEIVDGTPAFVFGAGAGEIEKRIGLIVERSETLLPGSFETIVSLQLRRDEPPFLELFAEAPLVIEVSLNDVFMNINDKTPAEKAFYRLGATLLE